MERLAFSWWLLEQHGQNLNFICPILLFDKAIFTRDDKNNCHNEDAKSARISKRILNTDFEIADCFSTIVYCCYKFYNVSLILRNMTCYKHIGVSLNSSRVVTDSPNLNLLDFYFWGM